MKPKRDRATTTTGEALEAVWQAKFWASSPFTGNPKGELGEAVAHITTLCRVIDSPVDEKNRP